MAEEELFGCQSAVTPIEAMSSAPMSGRVGADDVDEVHRVIQRFYSVDDQYGGGRLCDAVLNLLQRVHRLLAEGVYTDQTGAALRSAAGHVSELAGWVFFDAGDQKRARHHYLEALFAAQVAQDHRLTTLTLSSMSTQAYYQGHPQEALDLIRAAEASARGWGTPQVRSMLALREAVAYAAMRDRSAFTNAIARAQWEHADTTEAADPHWAEWLSDSELTVQEASCFMDLGEPGDLQRAETLLRCVLEGTAADPYRRNRVLYVTWLASVLCRRGDARGAAEIGMQALDLQEAVSSARSGAHLRALRNRLSAHGGDTVVRDFLDRYHLNFAGVNG
jgi:hypothetical protein